MPVIVGAPRSGTTLLRFMLDAHPDLAIPAETGFARAVARLRGGGDRLRRRFFDVVVGYPPEAPGWSDYRMSADLFRARLAAIEPFDVAEGVRTFYRMYAAQHGKPRYGDKTPEYVTHLATVEALLPEARFVHIVRDGRDVALSWRGFPFSPGHEIETLAYHWRRAVLRGRAQGARCRHYLEVHYEDLIADPEAVLRRICAFVELEFDERMLAYHERVADRLREYGTRYGPDGLVVATLEERLRKMARTARAPDASRVLAWKRDMDAAERSRFETVAQDGLRAFGYEETETLGGRPGWTRPVFLRCEARRIARAARRRLPWIGRLRP